MAHKKTDEGYPIFRSYLEEENDKPYYSVNTLSFYYEDMERKQKLIEDLAKAIAGYDQTLTGNLAAIEQQVAERFEQWDEKLKTFDGSVMDLLQEWVDDGTMDHIVDSSIVDRKLAETLKKGQVSVADIDKNKGLLDQTYLTDALKQQIAGTAPINAVPADYGITNKKLAKKSVNIGNIADALVTDFNGKKAYARYSNDVTTFFAVFGVLDLQALGVDVANKTIKIGYEGFADDTNIISTQPRLYIADGAASVAGGSEYKAAPTTPIIQNDYFYISNDIPVTVAKRYAHVGAWFNTVNPAIWSTVYVKKFFVIVDGVRHETVVNHYLYNPASTSTLTDVKNLPLRLVENTQLELEYLKKERLLQDLNVMNSATEKYDYFETKPNAGSEVYVQYMFDINDAIPTLDPAAKYEASYDLYVDDNNLTTIGYQIFANNDPIIGNYTGGLIAAAKNLKPFVPNVVNNYSAVSATTVNPAYRYVRLALTMVMTDPSKVAKLHIKNVKLKIGDKEFKVAMDKAVLFGNNNSAKLNVTDPIKLVQQKDLLNVEATSSNWSGKSFITLGDSITWQDGKAFTTGPEAGIMAIGYQTVMKEKLKFSQFANVAISGRPMANGTTPGVGTNTTGKAQTYSAHDLVVIAAGTNDFGLNVPLGTKGIIGDTTFDTNTFYGAYRDLIEYILTQKPTIRIVLFTPLQRDSAGNVNFTNTAGHKLIDYGNAIKEIGEMYSIPVCDMYGNSGITKLTLSAFTRDNLHPNNAGYARMGDYASKFINAI